MKNPPCSEWKRWLGREIEGHEDLGVLTLFVRSGDVLHTLDDLEAVRNHVSRVWLCKEFLHSHGKDALIALTRKLTFRGIKTCVEVTAHQAKEYEYLRHYVRFYVKFDLPFLVAGDHLCVGPAFADESFVVGKGAKVIPANYEADVCLD